MSISQFLIIFWARRILIVSATVSCLVGALIVCAILPPRWDSAARVMLDYIKPDPVTGEMITGRATQAYVDTQIQLVTDYTVAGRVAEQAGWLSDPELLSEYNGRSKADARDYRRWLADIVIAHTKVKLVEGSNILEITYTDTTAERAKRFAESLRQAYLDDSLEVKQLDARKNAAWYANESSKAKQALDDAVAVETAFERANGVVMQDNKTDADSARLQALSTQSAPLVAPTAPASFTSPISRDLAAVDSEIALNEKTLGPNNPEMQALRAKRAALAVLVAKDNAAAQNATGRAASGGLGALNQAVEAQKAKVIGQSEKMGKLAELHQDVELRRTGYEQASAKTAQYRQEEASDDVNITALGTAATPTSPAFPNYWLIVPGSIVLGLAFSLMVSLLMELLGRRVRSPDDLDMVDDVPLVCVVPGPESEKRQRSPDDRGWTLWRPNHRGPVGA